MTLDEIKAAIGEKIDEAWHTLKDEVNPDAARALASKLTAEVYAHVLEVEAHLINHVLGNAAPPADPGAVQPNEPPAAPADAPTGMAAHPPASADESVPADVVEEPPAPTAS